MHKHNWRRRSSSLMRARVRTDDSTGIFTAFYKETGRENRRRIDDVCPPQDLFTFSANPPKSTIRRKMASTPLSLNVRRKDTTSIFRQKFNWGYDSPFFCDILNYISSCFWREKREAWTCCFRGRDEINHDSLMSHLDGAITGQDSWATKSYCVKPHGASRRVSFVF